MPGRPDTAPADRAQQPWRPPTVEGASGPGGRPNLRPTTAVGAGPGRQGLEFHHAANTQEAWNSLPGATHQEHEHDEEFITPTAPHRHPSRQGGGEAAMAPSRTDTPVSRTGSTVSATEQLLSALGLGEATQMERVEFARRLIDGVGLELSRDMTQRKNSIMSQREDASHRRSSEPSPHDLEHHAWGQREASEPAQQYQDSHGHVSSGQNPMEISPKDHPVGRAAATHYPPEHSGHPTRDYIPREPEDTRRPSYTGPYPQKEHAASPSALAHPTLHAHQHAPPHGDASSSPNDAPLYPPEHSGHPTRDYIHSGRPTRDYMPRDPGDTRRASYTGPYPQRDHAAALYPMEPGDTRRASYTGPYHQKELGVSPSEHGRSAPTLYAHHHAPPHGDAFSSPYPQRDHAASERGRRHSAQTPHAHQHASPHGAQHAAFPDGGQRVALGPFPGRERSALEPFFAGGERSALEPFQEFREPMRGGRSGWTGGEPFAHGAPYTLNP
ncbi:hypothetical protein T484DRAFT_1882853 [Baffinella frigidus]|nr:hypothetical protein T484DRAFT_1882853 [Cryptophyta sp. CCMP2293]